MTCDQIRVALSARLDAEDPGVPAERLDGHLARCPACRDWLARAEEVTRAVRVPAPARDLTAAVLTAVAADPASDRHARLRARRQVLRVAVGVAALAQLVMAVQALWGVVPLDPHTGREAASFDVAVAVGFGLAAYRPERARAFVPVAFVLAACLSLTSVVDMAAATTALVHEFGHLAAVAQAGLLWALGRSTPPAREGGASAVALPA